MLVRATFENHYTRLEIECVHLHDMRFRSNRPQVVNLIGESPDLKQTGADLMMSPDFPTH